MRWLAEVERTQPADASENRAAESTRLAVDALHRAIDGRCDVRLGTLAKTGAWRTGRVEIQTGEGETLRAGAAVITVPLPLLDPPSDEPAALRIVPRLEQKQKAAPLLRMGPEVKVELELARPVWQDRRGLEQALARVVDVADDERHQTVAAAALRRRGRVLTMKASMSSSMRRIRPSPSRCAR